MKFIRFICFIIIINSLVYSEDIILNNNRSNFLENLMKFQNSKIEQQKKYFLERYLKEKYELKRKLGISKFMKIDTNEIRYKLIPHCKLRLINNNFILFIDTTLPVKRTMIFYEDNLFADYHLYKDSIWSFYPGYDLTNRWRRYTRCISNHQIIFYLCGMDCYFYFENNQLYYLIENCSVDIENLKKLSVEDFNKFIRDRDIEDCQPMFDLGPGDW